MNLKGVYNDVQSKKKQVKNLLDDLCKEPKDKEILEPQFANLLKANAELNDLLNKRCLEKLVIDLVVEVDDLQDSIKNALQKLNAEKEIGSENFTNTLLELERQKQLLDSLLNKQVELR